MNITLLFITTHIIKHSLLLASATPALFTTKYLPEVFHWWTMHDVDPTIAIILLVDQLQLRLGVAGCLVELKWRKDYNNQRIPVKYQT